MRKVKKWLEEQTLNGFLWFIFWNIFDQYFWSVICDKLANLFKNSQGGGLAIVIIDYLLMITLSGVLVYSINWLIKNVFHTNLQYQAEKVIDMIDIKNETKVLILFVSLIFTIFLWLSAESELRNQLHKANDDYKILETKYNEGQDRYRVDHGAWEKDNKELNGRIENLQHEIEQQCPGGKITPPTVENRNSDHIYFENSPITGQINNNYNSTK